MIEDTVGQENEEIGATESLSMRRKSSSASSGSGGVVLEEDGGDWSTYDDQDVEQRLLWETKVRSCLLGCMYMVIEYSPNTSKCVCRLL